MIFVLYSSLDYSGNSQRIFGNPAQSLPLVFPFTQLFCPELKKQKKGLSKRMGVFKGLWIHILQSQ
jgi:hypothetical protein